MTYVYVYSIIESRNEERRMEMARKRKKKHRLEKAALIVSIINGLVTAICLIYETFFK